MNVEELEIEVRRLVPEDGDVLVLKSKRPLRMDAQRHVANMIIHLRERLQKRIEFVILDDGLELEILNTSRLADLRPAATEQVAA